MYVMNQPIEIFIYCCNVSMLYILAFYVRVFDLNQERVSSDAEIMCWRDFCTLLGALCLI